MILTFRIVTLVTIIVVHGNCGKLERGKSDPDAIMFPGEDSSGGISSRGNFHDHHHHHHHFHHDFRDDKILNHQPKEIPLSFIQRLNEIDNETILFENFLEGEEKLLETQGIENRFGNVERASATLAKPANCKPSLETVELKVSHDPSLFIYPSCTRIERCGGCCSHSLLSCQPVQTETVTFQVIVAQYTGGGSLSAKEKELISVERHTKCKCDCIVKEGDCNSFQIYKKDACRCVCNNLDEQKKCEKFNDTKLWDPTECKCKCREISECTTGSYYDQSICKCMSIPVRRRFAELYSGQERNFTSKEKYDIEIPAVAPLQQKDEDDSN